METNQKWHQVRIIAKLDCWEPTEPALPKKLVQAEFTLDGRIRLDTTLLGIQNKRTGPLSYDRLFRQKWFCSSLRKRQLFFEQKICMKSNEITRQNNFAYKYAKLLKKFLVLELETFTQLSILMEK